MKVSAAFFAPFSQYLFHSFLRGFKVKGNSSKHLGTFPPFGYVKSTEDKNQWVIDYEAAEIVKEAFKLCMQGYGPTQIAHIFTENGYNTPIIYNRKHGLPTTHTIRLGQEIWSPKSIVGMLSRIEYTGCTANFKTYKKVVQVKKTHRPAESQLGYLQEHAGSNHR